MNDEHFSARSMKPFTKRFVAAAIIQGAGIVALTVILIIGQATFMKPEVSRVIAAGGAGTWFTFGFLTYIIVGVIGVAVSALFYHLIGGIQASRVSNGLAWAHLVLMNVGTTVGAGLMMYSGYIGGAAALPESIGGQGLGSGEVHELIGQFTEPIAGAILVLCAGVILGGIGFIISYMKNH